jgi:hypothetical protein
MFLPLAASRHSGKSDVRGVDEAVRDAGISAIIRFEWAIRKKTVREVIYDRTGI